MSISLSNNNALPTTVAVNLSSSTEVNSTASSTATPQVHASMAWLAGCSLFATGFIGTISYLVIFVAIFRERNTKFSGPYYRYFMSIGVAEIISLQYYGTFGPVCIALGYCPIPDALNRILGSLSMVVWNVEFFGDPIVMIDRLFAVCFSHKYQSWFGPKVVNFLATLIWILAIIWDMPYIVWYVPYVYDVWYFQSMPESFAIDGESTVFGSQTGLESVEIVMFIGVYGAVIIYLFWRRKQQAAAGISTNTYERAQRNLFVQSFCHVIVISSDVVIFNVIYNNFTSIWANLVGAILNQIYPMTTVGVTLALNDDVRGGVRAILCCRRQGNQRGSTTMAQVKRANTNNQIHVAPVAEATAV